MAPPLRGGESPLGGRGSEKSLNIEPEHNQPHGAPSCSCCYFGVMFKIPGSSSEGRGGRALRQGQPTYLVAFYSGGKALLGEGGSFPGAAQEASSSPDARHRRRQPPTPLRPLVRACRQHWAPSLPLVAVRFQASLLPSLSSVCSVVREGTKVKDAAAALPLNPAGLSPERLGGRERPSELSARGRGLPTPSLV